MKPGSPQFNTINFHFYASLRISIANRLRTDGAKSALRFVEGYVNGLVLQWNRLCEDAAGWGEVMETDDLLKNQEAARVYAQLSDRFGLDLHFYLICWDKVEKYVTRFLREQAAPEAQEVLRPIAPLLKQAARARDFLEHLESQLPAGNLGVKGMSISNDGLFTFRYEDISKKREKHAHEVTLGRAEVIRVSNAYIDLLRVLGVQEDALRPRPE